MIKLFVDGGPVYMAVLTILMASLFFAAWKAPRWVKEIGDFALVFGFLSLLLGLRQAFSVLQQVALDLGDGVTGVFDLVSPGVLFGGFKVSLIPVIYGISIYLASLVIRVVQKPRL